MNLTLNKFRNDIWTEENEHLKTFQNMNRSIIILCDKESEKQTIEEVEKAVKEITVKTHKRK